jgi:acetyl esterase/lipase
MSRAQLDHVSELLRNGPLDLGGEVTKMREIFAEMIAAVPVPADVRTRETTLGGVPALEVTAGGATRPGALLYFHGGAYALGSATTSVALVADIARRVGTTALTVDYRLAPEHTFPAAVDDAVAAYRALLDRGVPASSIGLVGESAGGGLALALLLRRLGGGSASDSQLEGA